VSLLQVGEWVKDAATDVKRGVEDSATDVKRGVEDSATVVKRKAEDIGSKFYNDAVVLYGLTEAKDDAIQTGKDGLKKTEEAAINVKDNMKDAGSDMGKTISDAASTTKEKVEDGADSAIETGKKGMKKTGQAASHAK